MLTSADHSSLTYPCHWKGKYYTEPYGKPDQESSQAKDRTVATNFWKLCGDLTQELIGERLE